MTTTAERLATIRTQLAACPEGLALHALGPGSGSYLVTRSPGEDVSPADAAFLAHARSTIAWLLDQAEANQGPESS